MACLLGLGPDAVGAGVYERGPGLSKEAGWCSPGRRGMKAAPPEDLTRRRARRNLGCRSRSR
jgi:hypothetical protein